MEIPGKYPPGAINPPKRAKERALYHWFQSLPEETKQRIRLSLSGPTAVATNGSSPRRFSASDNIIAAQGRAVAHSSDKARRLLGYTAPLSYSEGMALTDAWLRFARII